jgi:hypothetical protein
MHAYSVCGTGILIAPVHVLSWAFYTKYGILVLSQFRISHQPLLIVGLPCANSPFSCQTPHIMVPQHLWRRNTPELYVAYFLYQAAVSSHRHVILIYDSFYLPQFRSVF